jgi:hypothetical protein
VVLREDSVPCRSAPGAIPFAGVSSILTLSDRGHCASLEEAFILLLTKLATGDTNMKLADCFGYSGDGMVSLIYHFMIDLLDNKAQGC